LYNKAVYFLDHSSYYAFFGATAGAVTGAIMHRHLLMPTAIGLGVGMGFALATANFNLAQNPNFRE